MKLETRRRSGQIKRPKTVIGLLLCLVLIFASTLSYAEDTVKLGTILPLSGGVAKSASWVVDGINMAVADINAKGGIPIQGKNYKIDMTFYDTKCDPNTGVAAVEKLLHRDKVIGVVGGYCSHVTLPTREVTAKSQIVQVTPCSVHPKITEPGYPYMFRISDTTDMLVSGFVGFIVNHLKLKSIGFLAISDDYGRSYMKKYAMLLPERGVKVVATEYFKHGDMDFYTQITKILAAKPEAVFIVTDEDAQNVGTLKQLKELGFKGPILGASTYTTQSILDLAGKELMEGMYVEATYFELIRYEPDSQKWLKRYDEMFGKVGNEFVYDGYIATELIAAALRDANSVTDKDKIRAAVQNMNLRRNLTAFYGKPYFSENGQVTRLQGALQWQDGKMRIIYEHKK